MTYQETTMSGDARPRGGRRCGRMGWKPLEIVAMVLGFIVFWPIGLAILFFKIWQRKEGHQGDLVAFAQEHVGPNLQAQWDRATGGFARPVWRGQPWRPFGEMPSSGNAAFDDWRAAELARLEEERRKLVEAEREFAEHLDKLRRARDREEFERFMAERRAAQAASDQSANI